MNLRDFLGKLEADGELVRVKREVSYEYEIANVLNTLGEKPTIFEKVKDSQFPVFGGITSSRELIAKGLGTTRDGLLAKLVESLRKPAPPAPTTPAFFTVTVADTAGPAINPLIKVMNLVALIMAPIVVQTSDGESTELVLVVSAIGIALIVWSFFRSDRAETVEDAPAAAPKAAAGD